VDRGPAVLTTDPGGVADPRPSQNGTPRSVAEPAANERPPEWPTSPISLVVPLYGEQERLKERGPELVALVARQPKGSELLLVDDGSPDRTLDVARDLVQRCPEVPIRVLARPHQGKGATVRAGLLAASAPLVAFCDVDLSTPAWEVDRLLRRAEQQEGLVIGSRDVAGSTIVRAQQPHRELLGRAYNVLLRRTVVRNVRDTQCGAKAAPRDVWQWLLAHSVESGFAWDVEVIAVAQRLGVPVDEVAVEWSHDDRSTVQTGRHGLDLVLAVPRIARRVQRLPRAGAAAAAPPALRPSRAGADADHDDTVFRGERATELEEADREHWWFRAKARFVVEALAEDPPTSRARAGGPQVLVDLGCGAGGVTTSLGEAGRWLAGAEGSPQLASHALHANGVPAVAALAAPAPVRTGAVDVATLLDVIEHTPDPVALLVEARRLLAPGGVLVVTVPAHTWLWSRADELLGHVRRYRRRLLVAQLEEAGFEVVRCTHVFSWLVAPVWLQRRLGSDDEQAQLGLDRRSRTVTLVAGLLARAEWAVVRRRSSPFGTTILAVARPTRPPAR
jgi:dolichyl-phosphate beta-glucosyltransferase